MPLIRRMSDRLTLYRRLRGAVPKETGETTMELNVVLLDLTPNSQSMMEPLVCPHGHLVDMVDTEIAFVEYNSVLKIRNPPLKKQSGNNLGSSPKPEESPQLCSSPEPEESPQLCSLPKPEESPRLCSSPEPEEYPRLCSSPEPEESPQLCSLPKPEESPRLCSSPEPEESPRLCSSPEPEESPRLCSSPEPEESPRLCSSPKPEESPQLCSSPNPEESPRCIESCPPATQRRLGCVKCKTSFSSSVKPYATKCGHVFCNHCVFKMCRHKILCTVCQMKIKKRDLILLDLRPNMAKFRKFL